MLRLLILVLCLPLSAAAETLVFDVTLAGVAVATMTVRAEDGSGAYRATAEVATRGVAGVVRRVRWQAAVEGWQRGGRPQPAAYREAIDTGRRQSSVQMAWEGDVPRVLAAEGGEPVAAVQAADPADQRGTVDPLTALLAGLRSAPAARLCQTRLQVFDGRRRSAVSLADPQPQDGGVVCRGVYRRIAGFPPDDMAERPEFRFTVRYEAAAGGLYAVVRIDTDTLYGRAVLRRR